jgi:hypothetical protein
MKTRVAILISIGLLLVSCAPAIPTQEDEVVNVVTEESATEAPETQEPVITEEPIATESPTEAPTEPPLVCVTLLTPVNGVEILFIGKVTFSWTPMDEARNYILNIILPSGEIVPFETDQTFRDRYMESFVSGGEYKWRVIAQDKDGSEICVSEISAFNKPAFQKPTNGGGSGGDGGGNDGSGGIDGGGNKPPTGPG